MPSEPHLSEIVFVNSSSLTLQWTPPDTPNGIITQYSIQLNGNNITDLNSNVLMYTIGGLLPDTVYVLQLMASTSVGAGPPSSVTITTCELLMFDASLASRNWGVDVCPSFYPGSLCVCMFPTTKGINSYSHVVNPY